MSEARNMDSPSWHPLAFAEDDLAPRDARLLMAVEPSPDLPKPRRNAAAERNADIRQRHAAGESYRVLGEKYGISKERVRQIVHHESRSRWRRSVTAVGPSQGEAEQAARSPNTAQAEARDQAPHRGSMQR